MYQNMYMYAFEEEFQELQEQLVIMTTMISLIKKLEGDKITFLKIEEESKIDSFHEMTGWIK